MPGLARGAERARPPMRRCARVGPGSRFGTGGKLLAEGRSQASPLRRTKPLKTRMRCLTSRYVPCTTAAYGG